MILTKSKKGPILLVFHHAFANGTQVLLPEYDRYKTVTVENMNFQFNNTHTTIAFIAFILFELQQIMVCKGNTILH